MPLNVPLWVAVSAVLVTAIAVATDVRARRIPNLLTGPALLAALAAHAWVDGWGGVTGALLGMLVAGGLFFPGWFFGFMGAGDVKLMAVVGAWIGFGPGVVAVLASFMAGGVIALVVAARHGALGRALAGAAAIATWAAASRGQGGAPPPSSTGLRFPFALAIFAGTLVSLWVRP